MKFAPLTTENIATLKTTLVNQRDQILGTGKTLRVGFSTSRDDLMDDVDLALADISQGMSARLGNRLNLYFKKIEEALLRIRENEYGLCTSCGGNIGFKRLEARPTAEYCIECKEAAERGEALNAEGRRHKSLGDTISFKS